MQGRVFQGWKHEHAGGAQQTAKETRGEAKRRTDEQMSAQHWIRRRKKGSFWWQLVASRQQGFVAVRGVTGGRPWEETVRGEMRWP